MALMGSVDIPFTNSTQIAKGAEETANTAKDTANAALDEVRKANEPITDDKIVNIPPGTPTNVKASGLFESILIEWDYNSAIYISNYEVYGSQIKGFTPDSSNLIWRGKTSMYTHKAKTNQQWYFRVRAVNTHGLAGNFSVEVSAQTARVIFEDIDKEVTDSINKAKEDAQSAVDKANKATQDAQDAITQAQTAFDASNNANDLALVAKQMSETASSVASDAYKQAGTAITNAQSALDSAEKSLSDLSKLDQSVQTQFSNINGQLSSKVSQSTFNVLQGTVNTHTTQIQQTLTDISSKADKTLVDTINKTVSNHSTLISQNATDIKARATQSFVDTLTGRVTTAEANISINAKAITQNMLEVTNNYATKSSLSQTANSLTSTISQVQTNLDNLQIGGRNLLKNSNDFNRVTAYNGAAKTITRGVSVPEWSATDAMEVTLSGGTNVVKGIRSALEPSVKGVPYVLSVYIKNTGSVPITINPNGDGNTVTVGVGETTRAIMYKTGNGSSNVQFNYIAPSASDTIKFIAWHDQVEIGNKATDWSPAVEDMATVTQFSSLEQTLNGFTTRVGNAEGNISSLQQTANSLSSKITDAEKNISTLTQTAKGLQSAVNSKAESSVVTQLAGVVDLKLSKTDASKTYATQTQLTATSNSLTSKISESINNLQIGGRNLAPFDKWQAWSGTPISKGSNTITLTSDGTTYYGIYHYEDSKYEPNTDYILTFKASLISGSISIMGGHSGMFDDSPSITKVYVDGNLVSGAVWAQGVPISPSVGVTHTFEVHLRTKGDYSGGTKGMFIQPNRGNFGSTYSMKFWDLQIEEGNKATDWTPAPEDMATASQLSQLSDAINLRVQKGDVINQINVSTEDILIAGNKIRITGQTVIDNAVIKTAQIGDLAVTNAKIGNLAVDDAKIADLSVAKLKAGTIDTTKIKIRGEKSATEYTLIDGAYLESRGKFKRTWQGITETSDVMMKIENGYFRARNDTKNVSLYFSDFGISTYVDGDDQEASGTLSFFNTDYSTARGVTLQSGNGVVSLKSSKNRIVLDSNQTVNVESEEASIYFRPFKNTRVGNNVFNMWVKDNASASDTDGVIYYGSDVNGWGSGIRFSKKSSEPIIYATGQDGDIGTGIFHAERFHSASGSFESKGKNLVIYHTNSSGYLYLQTPSEVRATKPNSPSSYVPVRASSFPTGSMEEYKQDITLWKESALAIINSSDIYEYRLKSDVESGKDKIRHGLVIGHKYNTPATVIDGDGVEQYEMNSLSWKAIQELSEQNENLILKIASLEMEVANIKRKLEAV